MLEAVVLVSVSVAVPQMPPQDPVQDYRAAARTAAYRYERLLRQRAPYRMGGGYGDYCDEIIGRFCFRFGDGDEPERPPEPEHEDIDEARRVAVRAHRRWLSADPTDTEAAGGLVRYLIAGGRAREAASLARTHTWAAGKTPESLLLLGLALHYAVDFEAAEAVFDSARALVSEEEREEWDDVGMLLEPRERSRYGDLSSAEREAYNRRFWAFSDPSLFEAGNERRSAHYARRAWVQILSKAPRVEGMVSWGSDHEEIVLRYGLPTSRERIRQPAWRWDAELRMVETFDPHAVSYVPAALGDGMVELPPPGVRPELERDTARSFYAGVHLHRMRGLDLQVARLPTPPGALLRVAGMLPPDTVDPGVPVRPRGLFVVMDTMGNEVARTDAAIQVRPDSVTVIRGELLVPPGAYVYRLELADDSTGLAGLSQYRIDVQATDGLGLGDPIVAVPGSGTPTRSDVTLAPSLVLSPHQTVWIFAEASGLNRTGGRSRYSVEWWVEPLDQGSLLGRATRWLGRRLGLINDEDPVRVRWEDGSEERGPIPVAFTVDLSPAKPGLHRLGLTIRDQVSGESVTSTRLLRIDPAADPLPVPGRD